MLHTGIVIPTNHTKVGTFCFTYYYLDQLI
jgi:hypothetical protein